MHESYSAEVRDLLALQLVPGIGPKLTAALINKFGSAAAVLKARASELRSIPHIGERLAEKLSMALQQIDVDAELRLLEQHRVRLLVRGMGGFPGELETIPGPPQLLYFRGQLLDCDRQAVAIVGSRNCTSYGRRAAQRLASDLARAGYTVVSGLARGIDGHAHLGALEAGGRTLAVLAGGLRRIYPPEHTDLAANVEAAGALLTEAAMNMEPLAGMFPARNRLISGLSRGVVVVEAAEQSGALITASHAAEQGRPVFALPGPIDSPASGGTHRLIRQGAILIRGAEDIIEELEGVGRPAVQKKQIRQLPELNPVQQQIWEFLATAPRHADEFVQHLGLPVPDVSNQLLLLEMKKVLRRLPGNQYERFS